MKNNGLFFSEGAYQWAETLLEKAPQSVVDVDYESMCRLLRQDDFYDQGITFYESYEDKNPLMMIENINIKKRKSKVLVYPVSKESFENFKTAYPEIVQLLLMNGRNVFKKELAHGRASLPIFQISAY